MIDNFNFYGVLATHFLIKYNWIYYIYLVKIEDIESPFCDEGILE